MAAELSPLVIKLNNFLLYSASGCIVPYLSVYFLHYTEANSSDVGLVMLFASFFGIVSSLLFCSVGDRYRAHRTVYIVSLCLTCLSFTVLFGPIAMGMGKSSNDDNSGATTLIDDDTTTELLDFSTPVTDMILSEVVVGKTSSIVNEQDEHNNSEQEPSPAHNSTLYRAAADIENELFKFQPSLLAATGYSKKLCFYIVAVCLGFGLMTMTVNINMSDSFSTEIASKCRTSYGAVRLWGSSGLLFSSTILIFINKIDWAPYLAPSLCLFACLSLVNILLVVLWPDNRPFDLSNGATVESSAQAGISHDLEWDELKLMNGKLEQQQQLPVVVDKTKPNEMRANELRFEFKRSPFSLFGLGSSETKRNCSIDLSLQDIFNNRGEKAEENSNEPRIVLSKARQSFVFDSAAEDVCRNVRRCSLAPLGDSHLLKQFELASDGSADKSPKNCKTLAHKLTQSSPINEIGITTQKHFNFVTIIEPLDSQLKLTEQAKQFNLMLEKTSQLDDHHDHHKHQQQKNIATVQYVGKPQQLAANEEQRQRNSEQLNKPISLRLHLKIIELIARKDPNMFRFMLMFSIVGFTSSMNIVYLFLYLDSLDKEKFKSLSAFVIMSTFLSETIFYRYSTKFTRSLDNSTSLSLVLFVYVLRYSLYLSISIWPHIWPMESIVAIELLQSFSMGLFNCVFTDASFKFALEARDCVPKLIELKLIDGSKESIEQVNNGVKLTLLSVSSCCYDGIGMAFGSLIGGWLIDGFGFATLWLTGIVIALIFGTINLMITHNHRT